MASISTPVRSTVSTWASTSTQSSPIWKFTKTDPTSKGWQRGMRFGVCLAAWMPATRATDSTSPLEMLLEAMSPVVSGFISTLQRAIARRWVASLGVTSTMRARPRGSRWVNRRSDIGRSLEVKRLAQLRPSVVVGAQQQDLHAAARRQAVAVGHQGQGIGRRRGRQLVGALTADRPHLRAAVVARLSDDAHE